MSCHQFSKVPIAKNDEKNNISPSEENNSTPKEAILMPSFLANIITTNTNSQKRKREEISTDTVDNSLKKRKWAIIISICKNTQCFYKYENSNIESYFLLSEPRLFHILCPSLVSINGVLYELHCPNRRYPSDDLLKIHHGIITQNTKIIQSGLSVSLIQDVMVSLAPMSHVILFKGTVLRKYNSNIIAKLQKDTEAILQ